MLSDALGLHPTIFPDATDTTELALQRFNNRCLFMPDGQRLEPKMFNYREWSLMPGTFNPPHQGHFGLAHQVELQYNAPVVFEVCATPPHKPAMTVQQMLQRAKLLRGHRVLFTQCPLYLDKARAHFGVPLVVGADALLRLLDPKWGVEIEPMLQEFDNLCTDFYVGSRMVDGKIVSCDDIKKTIDPKYHHMFWKVFETYDMTLSSTEIRNKIL